MVVERNGAGGDGLPSTFLRRDRGAGFPGARGAGFASRVGKLNAGDGTFRVDEIRDAFERGDVLVFPDSEVLGRDAAARFHG